MTLPILSPAVAPTLTSSRVTRFAYDLLDRNGMLIGPLDGVQPGGSLTWTANQAVKGRGSLTISDTGQAIDWLADRIRISATITGGFGTTIIPLGVWIPSTPTDQWTDAGRTWPVSLLDVTSLLDMRSVATNYTVTAGSVVTDQVAALLTTASLSYAITPSALTTAVDHTWPAGTTYLQVVNDLLAGINYFSLWADGVGALHADPYIAPAQRGIVWEFVDGANCIYSPSWQRAQDWSSVPNQIILTTQGGTSTAGLVSVYNAPDTDPTSAAATGRVRSYASQVTASDQPTLDALAVRMYTAMKSAQAQDQIHHGPVPLAVNQAVRFRSTRAAIDTKCVIASTQVILSPTALAYSTMTEV